MQANTLEIGQRVKWTVGTITRYGIFKQIIGETAEVKSLRANDQPICLTCFVPLQLIEIDN